MKKHNKVIPILVTIFATALFFFVLSPVFKSEAGALSETYLYLSRIQANLTGVTPNDVEMILAFRPSQAFSALDTPQVEIFFPVGDNNKWCRTAGALAVEGVTAAAPDVTGHDITAALPGTTLLATCTQGDGIATGDTITISGVGDLVSTATYGVKVSNGSPGILGTSATSGSKTIVVQVSDNNNLDSSAFGVYLLTDDTVEVTAEVSPVPIVNCQLNSTSISLGILYPGGGLVEVSSTDQLTTNSPNSGYYWAAYGKGNGTNAGLYDGTNLIQSGSGTGIVDITGAGSEGFGINLTQPSGATVVTDFSYAVNGHGVYGSLGATETGARLILYKTTVTPTDLSATVYYGARAGAGAVAGTYTEYLTYVCGGYY